MHITTYNVVGVFAFAFLTRDSNFGGLVKQPVRVNHIIHNAALADLLALELFLGG